MNENNFSESGIKVKDDGKSDFFQKLKERFGLSEEELIRLQNHQNDRQEMMELEVMAAKTGNYYEAAEEAADRVIDFEAKAREENGPLWQALQHVIEIEQDQFMSTLVDTGFPD